jgi:hypothetical protein
MGEQNLLFGAAYGLKTPTCCCLRNEKRDEAARQPGSQQLATVVQGDALLCSVAALTLGVEAEERPPLRLICGVLINTPAPLTSPAAKARQCAEYSVLGTGTR